MKKKRRWNHVCSDLLSLAGLGTKFISFHDMAEAHLPDQNTRGVRQIDETIKSPVLTQTGASGQYEREVKGCGISLFIYIWAGGRD